MERGSTAEVVTKGVRRGGGPRSRLRRSPMAVGLAVPPLAPVRSTEGTGG